MVETLLHDIIVECLMHVLDSITIIFLSDGL